MTGFRVVLVVVGAMLCLYGVSLSTGACTGDLCGPATAFGVAALVVGLVFIGIAWLLGHL